LVTIQSFVSEHSTPLPTSRALVIGGGIAGTVAAMALQRADIDAVIYEGGGPAQNEDGPYLTIATNGLDALAAIGVEDLVAGGGFATCATTCFNSSGKRIGTVGHAGDSVTIRQGRLQRLLQQAALDRGIRIEFGKWLIDAAIVPRGVEARFADGSAAAGELLVGCDGVRSSVRRILDPAAAAPRAHGVVTFGGQTPSIAAGIPGQWQMVFGRRVFFGYAADATGGTVWFAQVPRAALPDAGPAAAALEEWRSLLAGLVEGDRSPAGPLIAKGTVESMTDDTLDVPYLRRWHYGPLIVIGDAAHAAALASDQGVSLAIEDGVLLAKHLRQLPTVPAFAAFERARRRRVERVVAQGARSTRLRAPGPAGRLVRDLMLPTVFRYLMTERSLAWMHDHRVNWHRPVVNA